MNEVVRRSKRSKAEEKVEVICYYFLAFAVAYFVACLLEGIFWNSMIDLRAKIFSSQNIAFVKSMVHFAGYLLLAFILFCIGFGFLDAVKRSARQSRKNSRKQRRQHLNAVEQKQKKYKENNFFHMQMIRPYHWEVDEK